MFDAKPRHFSGTMTPPGDHIAGDQSGLGQGRGRRRRSAGRSSLLRFLLAAVAGAIVVGVAVGFVGFARSVLDASAPDDPRADGIVVLTGATARIDGALSLLAEGRAERLLISGVNPSVTRDMLAETVNPAMRSYFDCCVDLDHARDTVENASETQRWMQERDFTSLIVVTSDYHIPRSMAELAAALPDVRLIAFPINNPDLHLGDWWRNPRVFALLVREYGKYLIVESRQFLSPRMATTTDF